MGKAESKLGHFTLSLDHYKKAFKLTGYKDGSISYEIAKEQEALHLYEEAEESLSKGAELLSNDSRLWSEAVFDRGRIALILWLNGEAPRNAARFRSAALAFQTFLDRQGWPPQWAHYHLACLK